MLPEAAAVGWRVTTVGVEVELHPTSATASAIMANCQTTNQGDPIVLYDEETDRWLVSQFAFPDNFSRFSLCIAASETGDPTGRYFGHEFDFTGIGFPDYPKYGFVTDAISVMVNLFVPFQGTGLGAIDKSEAFSTKRTTMAFFKVGTNEFGFLPGDNDGPVFDSPPAGVFLRGLEHIALKTPFEFCAGILRDRQSRERFPAVERLAVKQAAVALRWRLRRGWRFCSTSHDRTTPVHRSFSFGCYRRLRGCGW